MSQEILQSPFINQLNLEITQNGLGSINGLLKANKNPIVEAIPNDDENSLVTFIYKATEDVKDIAVYGSAMGFKVYREKNLMTLLEGTNLYYKTYKFKNNIQSVYFFSIDEKNNQDKVNEITLDINNPNKFILYGDKEDETSNDMVYSLLKLKDAPSSKWTVSEADIRKGEVKEQVFHSEILASDRKLSIYTAHDYKQIKSPCPLIIFTDAQSHINQLKAINVLDNLINEGAIPSVVAVFIPSSEARMKELSCDDSFSDFIIKELLPFIKDNYNVTDKPSERIITGFSLGGLFATYMGLKHSECFGNVLSQSGSFWWYPGCPENTEECEWIKEEFEKSNKLPLKLYLNCGVFEDKPHPYLKSKKNMRSMTENLVTSLKTMQYQIEYEVFPSGHDYIYWGEYLAKGLKFLIGN